jgi:ATP-dependent RNA helicase A
MLFKVEETGEESISLIPDYNLEHLLPETTALEAGIVSWSPPNPNWNPWTGANIDDGNHK